MQKYIVRKALQAEGGRFRLTEEQFANRRYVVKVIDEKNRIVEPRAGGIGFKVGEIVETDMPVDKAMFASLEPYEEGSEVLAEGGSSGRPTADVTASSGGDGGGDREGDRESHDDELDDPTGHISDQNPADAATRQRARPRK